MAKYEPCLDTERSMKISDIRSCLDVLLHAYNKMTSDQQLV